MDLLDKAREWRDHDPDPVTREELSKLIDAQSPELSSRFDGPLSFGTAGLRGPVAAGESCMNVATVTKASAGLGAWLVERVEGERPKVVVGCDARHGSAEFRRVTAEVLSAAGCDVHLLPAQLPTPVTAYAVRRLNCDAGVMVTASHNPARDNGYKVYLGGRVVNSDHARGVQLISPADKEIAKLIAAVDYADEVPRDTAHVYDLPGAVLEDYVARAISFVENMPRDISIVITAMHGVGGQLLKRVLSQAGFYNVTPVAEQQEPDPEFPTVAFPNPEEEGALDLAMATGNKVGAQIILALDPDADRCSVAIPDSSSKTGWKQLSGDRVGALLGEDAARRATGQGALACSIVSSRLLEKIAENHGLQFAPTLTGFKWIGRTPGLVFGYEEALGYCTDPEAVRDKDGITACLRVADLAARVDNLDAFGREIDKNYGSYLTRPLTLRFEDPALITSTLKAVMEAPPRTLGGAEVTEVCDLSEGYLGLPATPGLAMLTAESDRVVIRPSGTEPKLKCYLEVISSDGDAAAARMDKLMADLREVLDS